MSCHKRAVAASGQPEVPVDQPVGRELGGEGPGRMRLALRHELAERLERRPGGGKGLEEDTSVEGERADLLPEGVRLALAQEALDDVPVQIDVVIAVRTRANLDDGSHLGDATEDEPPRRSGLRRLGSVPMKMRPPGRLQFLVGCPLMEKSLESQLELVQAGLHAAAHAALDPRATVLLS